MISLGLVAVVALIENPVLPEDLGPPRLEACIGDQLHAQGPDADAGDEYRFTGPGYFPGVQAVAEYGVTSLPGGSGPVTPWGAVEFTTSDGTDWRSFLDPAGHLGMYGTEMTDLMVYRNPAGSRIYVDVSACRSMLSRTASRR